MKRETQSLFTTKNPVDIAKEFQYLIEFEPNKETKRRMAVDALDVIGDPKEIFGSSRMLLHSLKAYIFYNHETTDWNSMLYHGTEFDDLVARANFRFGFAETSKLGSLSLLLYDTEIVDCKQQEFCGERIDTGMIIPVMDIESVWPAK